ncbi:hypothetical protein LAZ67_14002287 [Cordylochernes scorpioides]|uniref:Uncharacterized protein n=1 Tax=Cordylochernes scorpioides TaxID=51811 RepID=A0ABY6LAW6_9ARAC|nr:hypothetical protein LAZ67_14002287 [Cordylochernes scorpioides]
MWSMVAQRLTQITSPAAISDQLWQSVEAAWSAVPQEHIQRDVVKESEDSPVTLVCRFSETCRPDAVDYVCVDCEQGYTGRHCERWVVSISHVQGESLNIKFLLIFTILLRRTQTLFVFFV